MCQSQLEINIPRRSPEVKDTTIAVDIAKDIFGIAVSHKPGVVNDKQRVTRKKLLSFFVNQQPATVVMEACGSAHHWAREVEKLGHRPVLLPRTWSVPMSNGTSPTKATQRGCWKLIGTKTSNRCR